MSKQTVAVFGTFDTKGEENAYLIQKLEQHGLSVVTIDMGTREPPPFPVAIERDTVAAAGGSSIEALAARGDRAFSLDVMSEGCANILRDLCESGEISGVIAMGGGQGTYMGGRVLRKLRIGLPKVFVSTVITAPGSDQFLSGVNDTMLMNTLVDVCGLNPLLCMVLDKAAATLAGMMKAHCELKCEPGKVRVGISMWGVTTPCVNMVRTILEKNGCEVYVFHANGLGGQLMECLIRQGFLNAVADITISELTIALAGGASGENADKRLDSACEAGIPQVVSVGGADMVMMPVGGSIPPKFSGRKSYAHNSEITFVRSSVEENILFAKEIARKLNSAKGPVTVVLPRKGTSSSNKEGGPLYQPECDEALIQTLRQELQKAEILELDYHINDVEFAKCIAACVLQQVGLPIKDREEV